MWRGPLVRGPAGSKRISIDPRSWPNDPSTPVHGCGSWRARSPSGNPRTNLRRRQRISVFRDLATSSGCRHGRTWDEPAANQPWRASQKPPDPMVCARDCVRCGSGGCPDLANGESKTAERHDLRHHFKKIVLALHAYHDTTMQFPPAYFADRTGRPIHSWRILILPFLGERRLYDQYRFDEPWDGPHNRELVAQMPAVFRCPADRGDASNTSYLAVTGEGTVFPGARCCRISDILDGTSNTILFVETTDYQINWMQPRDLTYDQALAGINPQTGTGISGRHGRFATVATVDGSIWLLPESVSRDTLRKLLLRNDGEMIPDFGRPQGSAVEPPQVPDSVPQMEEKVYK